MKGWSIALLALLLSAPAFAAPLTVVKSLATVSDPLGETNPKAIPGAVLDYTVKITNPNAGLATGVVFSDAVPANTKLYVNDINLLGGPVVFTDGSLIGLGGSGLTYTYASLSSKTDKIDFSSDGGVTWAYVPVADSSGCDAAVTNIRVSPSGSMNGNSYFSLRFRIQVK
ncbi:hypothetical protein DMC47_32940 [Nostoc sp. 3335mG]|nr:hypothetical protein DMC47_32940 [Nostoc sp. 3335mG]